MPDEVYGDAFEKLGGCILRRPVSIPVPFIIRFNRRTSHPMFRARFNRNLHFQNLLHQCRALCLHGSLCSALTPSSFSLLQQDSDDTSKEATLAVS